MAQEIDSLIRDYCVSVGNKLSIIKFFQDLKFHTKSEQAKAVKRSPSTIDKWAKSCSWREKRKQFATPTNKRQPKQYEPITDQNVWDNRDWLNQKYTVERIGIETIARIVNRKPLIIYRRLKKYKIPIRKINNTSSNPCCNEKWLIYHYGTPSDYRKWCQTNFVDIDSAGGQCMTQRECAALAGVEQYTIYNWLIKFNIPIRDVPEALVYSRRKKNGLLKSQI